MLSPSDRSGKNSKTEEIDYESIRRQIDQRSGKSQRGNRSPVVRRRKEKPPDTIIQQCVG